jgi:hypothetical protein
MNPCIYLMNRHEERAAPALVDAKTQSDALFEILLQTVGRCPPVWNRKGRLVFPGLAPVGRQLPGLGFFPGGDGLWKLPGATEPADLSAKPVMLVGSTFGTAAEFRSLIFEEDRDARNKTWSILIDLLQRAEVPCEQCFFTNAYPGLLCDLAHNPGEKKGRGGNVVKLAPAQLDQVFVSHCRAFFLEQVRHFQPRLILFLGLYGPYILGEELIRQSGWARFLHSVTGKIDRIREIDSAGLSLVTGLSMPGVGHPFSLAILLHPGCVKSLL